MSREPSKYRIWLYFAFFAGAIVVALFSYEFVHRYPVWTLRAFKIPSRSMCPTICNGERIFVQMLYGRPYIPKRGDVVVLEYGPDRALFVKRIIGLPGDVIAPGPQNTILINSKPWQPPAVCAKSLLARDTNTNMPLEVFAGTKVPSGQVFVIGDNLNDSLDSRIRQFEPITADQVIGQPAMIYWSPDSSRIGCPIH